VLTAATVSPSATAESNAAGAHAQRTPDRLGGRSSRAPQDPQYTPSRRHCIGAACFAVGAQRRRFAL
jgi:hypothetical protein